MYRLFLFLIISLALVGSLSGQQETTDTFYLFVAKAAVGRTYQQVEYDPSYYSIDYPGGDIPQGKGVCTDLVIRAYREAGIDLQQKVHEDMDADFQLYPKTWGLTRPDKNIDHRRVPNLMVFFSRHGQNLPICQDPEKYSPGDIITWSLGNGITHVGIVSNKKNVDGTRWLIAHNIGNGPELEDMLFNFKITGHYRYDGK